MAVAGSGHISVDAVLQRMDANVQRQKGYVGEIWEQKDNGSVYKGMVSTLLTAVQTALEGVPVTALDIALGVAKDAAKDAVEDWAKSKIAMKVGPTVDIRQPEDAKAESKPSVAWDIAKGVATVASTIVMGASFGGIMGSVVSLLVTIVVTLDKQEQLAIQARHQEIENSMRGSVDRIAEYNRKRIMQRVARLNARTDYIDDFNEQKWKQESANWGYILTWDPTTHEATSYKGSLKREAQSLTESCQKWISLASFCQTRACVEKCQKWFKWDPSNILAIYISIDTIVHSRNWLSDDPASPQDRDAVAKAMDKALGGNIPTQFPAPAVVPKPNPSAKVEQPPSKATGPPQQKQGSSGKLGQLAGE